MAYIVGDIAAQVLEKLALYRFLTAAQMQAAGVKTEQSHLYSVLRQLARTRPALVMRLDFGVLPSVGKLSAIHYLTPKGAATVAEYYRLDPSEVKHPKRVATFRQDYFHRLALVNLHITARTWSEEIGAELDFWDSYFDGAAGVRGFYPKTAVSVEKRRVVPDAVFQFTKDSTPRLCILEISMGQDTKRVLGQFTAHYDALKSKVYSEKYGVQTSPRVLWLFETEGGLQSVQKRLEMPADYAPAFFLKTLSDVQEKGFLNGWRGVQAVDGLRPLF